MNNLIIGNIIALIAASASIILGFIKNREKIIFIQILFCKMTLNNSK